MTEEMLTLKENLLKLSLKTMANIFEEEASRSAKAKLSYTDYLKRLIEEEIITKTDRSINAKITRAKFPCIKTIENFDFSFQPTIPEKYIKELGKLGFIKKAENIIFLGPAGVGKTHLSIALGVLACQDRRRVFFSSAVDLIEDLVVALESKTLPERLTYFTNLDLLIIDELGYMPIGKQGANLFFQLISRRYETGSIILTSNKPFNEWGEIFGDDAIASAIIDRLAHHSHILSINGPSYRIKDKVKKGENNKIG